MTLNLVVAARNYCKTDAGLTFDMVTDILRAGQTVWRETCVFLSRWPESAQRTGGRPAAAAEGPERRPGAHGAGGGPESRLEIRARRG